MPTYGVFVKERVKAIAEAGYEVRVVAPTPYFPPLPCFERWYCWSQVPREEMLDGISVVRPRYVLPPKLGGFFHSELMFRAAGRAVERIRREFDFDLLDAHFVYPNGVIAVKLGRLYNKPVVVTGRGEDMLRFPGLPVLGTRIRKCLSGADRLVALSREIAEAMQRHGGEGRRICIVPNGVDVDRFHPHAKDDARRRLGLPAKARVLLSVGDCCERKGFHLLVDALAEVRRRYPDAILAIVGGPPRHGRDFTPVIQQRIEAAQLGDAVQLAGRVLHADLAEWYSAADLFVLLSGREGSPNVLMEALACGCPAVATSVGGIPEVLCDDRLGMLVEKRTSGCAAQAIGKALARGWDRTEIQRQMPSKSWQRTAQQLAGVFEEAVAAHAAADTSW